MSNQSPRTKAKIKENLGLLMEGLRGKYGTVDEWIEEQIFNALSWTANDVQEQMETRVESAHELGYDSGWVARGKESDELIMGERESMTFQEWAKANNIEFEDDPYSPWVIAKKAWGGAQR